MFTSMFSYFYEGVEHTDTSTEYCAKLGMNDEQIQSVQQDALNHSETQWSIIRAERLKRIYEMEWRINRMFRENTLELTRTDSDETMQAVHRIHTGTG